MPPRRPPADSSTEERRNTSLRLRKSTLKALKMRAIEEDTSVQSIVERLIVAYLRTPLPDTDLTGETVRLEPQ